MSLPSLRMHISRCLRTPYNKKKYKLPNWTTVDLSTNIPDPTTFQAAYFSIIPKSLKKPRQPLSKIFQEPPPPPPPRSKPIEKLQTKTEEKKTKPKSTSLSRSASMKQSKFQNALQPQSAPDRDLPELGAVIEPMTLPPNIDFSTNSIFVTNLPRPFEEYLIHFRVKSASRVSGFPNTLQLTFADAKECESGALQLHGRSIPYQLEKIQVVNSEQVTYLYDFSIESMTTIVVIENLPANVSWKRLKDMVTRARCRATINVPKYKTDPPPYIRDETPLESYNILKYVEIRFASVIEAKRFISRYNGEFYDIDQSYVPAMDIFFRFLRDLEMSKNVLEKSGMTKEELLEDYMQRHEGSNFEDELEQGRIFFAEVVRLLQ